MLVRLVEGMFEVVEGTINGRGRSNGCDNDGLSDKENEEWNKRHDAKMREWDALWKSSQFLADRKRMTEAELFAKYPIYKEFNINIVPMATMIHEFDNRTLFVKEDPAPQYTMEMPNY